MYIRILAIHCITEFLKIRNIISKNRRSKVADFAALRAKVISTTYFYPEPDNIFCPENMMLHCLQSNAV